MKLGDTEHLICQLHNAYSFIKHDTCADCEIESLQRQLAQANAVIEEQKETIEGLNNTVRTCDELSRLARIKRDEQSELIEKLSSALRSANGNHRLDALNAYNEWKENKC